MASASDFLLSSCVINAALRQMIRGKYGRRKRHHANISAIIAGIHDVFRRLGTHLGGFQTRCCSAQGFSHRCHQSDVTLAFGSFRIAVVLAYRASLSGRSDDNRCLSRRRHLKLYDLSSTWRHGTVGIDDRDHQLTFCYKPAIDCQFFHTPFHGNVYSTRASYRSNCTRHLCHHHDAGDHWDDYELLFPGLHAKF